MMAWFVRGFPPISTIKHIVHPQKIASVDGEINSYIIRYEANVLPMLCYADEIAKGSPFPFFAVHDRKKPIF